MRAVADGPGGVSPRERDRGHAGWRGSPGLPVLPWKVHKARAKGHPSVVLLDLKLPKVDGLEVLRQIKSDQTLAMIPVVVLTSSREERDMVDSYKLGVNAYVVKPVDFHEFANAIKELGVFWALINEPPPGSVRRK
jgi:CheY-like chemotaxis protein